MGVNILTWNTGFNTDRKQMVLSQLESSFPYNTCTCNVYLADNESIRQSLSLVEEEVLGQIFACQVYDA